MVLQSCGKSRAREGHDFSRAMSPTESIEALASEVRSRCLFPKSTARAPSHGQPMPPLPLIEKPPAPSTKPEFQRKPPRQPMLWAALSYALGIVAGTHAWRPASWWVAAAVAFLAASLYFMRRRKLLAVSLALGAFFLAGALHIQLRGSTNALDPTLEPFADGQPVELTAHVTREGKFRESSNEIRQTLDVESEEIIAANGKPISVHSGVRLGIYSAHADATPQKLLHYGERLRLTVKLKLPRNFRNPGAFDYQQYLAANGISALGSAKAEDVKVLPGFSGNRLELWRTRIHASIIAKVHALWPPSQAALIDAMVIGEEAFIDRDTRVDFQRSGTYHILVVSGMNVTILAFVAFWTLRRLRLGDVPATLLTILFCVAYALLNRSRSARLARHADVRHLPRHPPALPRPRHGQRARRSRSRIARLRSPPALHRKFPDDISLRPNRGRDRPAAHRAHLAPLPPGPRPLGDR